MDKRDASVGIEIRQKRLLIVEGEDEKNLFSKLAERMEISNLQILPVGGKQALRNRLPAVGLVTNNFLDLEAIGIVQDADDKPRETLQSVQKTLKDNHLHAPSNPMVPKGESPIVVILILPGAGQKGSLETLCVESLCEDPAMNCVEKYLACLKRKRVKLPPNLDKVKAYAFCASRRPPLDEIGVAAKASCWDLNAEAFAQVKEFIRLVAGARPSQ
jgi:hypothetical protein